MAHLGASLTNSRINRTKAAERPLKLADGGGMYLLVRPDGARYWRLDYRFDGKRKTLALGVYPEVTLAEARKRRAAAKALLAEGMDPGALKKAHKILKSGSGNRGRAACDEITRAMNMIGEGVWDWDLRSGRVRHNLEWGHLMGFEDARLEHGWQQVRSCLSIREQRELLAAIRSCGPERPTFECEHRIRRADDSVIRVLTCGEVIERGPGGRPLRVRGSLRELKGFGYGELHIRQRNLLLQAIASVNEMLMADLSEADLMARICHGLLRENLFRMAWIGLVAEDGVTVRPSAEAGFEPGYLAQADIRCDDSPAGRGPVGTAIRQGRTIIDNDISREPRLTPWHEQARRYGIRASASMPLRAHGQVIGVLNVYSREHQAFGTGKVMLLEKLAADIGLAFDHRAALDALRESEERLRLISSVATDLLYSCGANADGSLTLDWATASVGRVFGYSVAEILDRGCWRCHVHPDDRLMFDLNITYLPPGQHSECELRIIAKDRSIRHIRAYTRTVQRKNGEIRVYGACQDVTDRKHAEEALRESEARFRAMAEQSADWIWAIDAHGRRTYSNQTGPTSLGYALEEFLALDPAALMHPDDLPRFHGVIKKAMSSGRGWVGVSLRRRHRDGSYRTFESSASPHFSEDGTLLGLQGMDRDVTERKVAEEHIEYLAHHDALTGLPNRILLRDRFARAQAVADRARTRVALVFLDLDQFKRVNDTLGHAAGDKLLLEVVTRLNRSVRETDTISRQGGDEFILLLNDLPDLESVERITDDILARVAEPMEIGGHILNTSCSIGIAVYPDDGDDFDALLQKADIAMYNAKDAGRNTWRFFDEEMNRQAHEHLLLQNRLHQAVFNSEFRLVYQPQIEIGSGRITGVEALLRWRNDELGEVMPDRFIPVAEESGLIVPIGAWVLHEACQQAQAWRQAGWADLSMSVNLSALQFRRPGLVETIAAALRGSGLPPHLLELELTESILLHDVEHNLDMVRRLKGRGVRLSIDDFGTGYSSLSYLKRFAVDRVKIDRSFVHDINNDSDDAAIVRAVIQLAGSLRLGVIAEGVETAAQFAFLEAAGCQEVQGHLFSEPLEAAAVETYLRGRRGSP